MIKESKNYKETISLKNGTEMAMNFKIDKGKKVGIVYVNLKNADAQDVQEVLNFTRAKLVEFKNAAVVNGLEIIAWKSSRFKKEKTIGQTIENVFKIEKFGFLGDKNNILSKIYGINMAKKDVYLQLKKNESSLIIELSEMIMENIKRKRINKPSIGIVKQNAEKPTEQKINNVFDILIEGEIVKVEFEVDEKYLYFKIDDEMKFKERTEDYVKEKVLLEFEKNMDILYKKMRMKNMFEPSTYHLDKNIHKIMVDYKKEEFENDLKEKIINVFGNEKTEEIFAYANEHHLFFEEIQKINDEYVVLSTIADEYFVYNTNEIGSVKHFNNMESAFDKYKENIQKLQEQKIDSDIEKMKVLFNQKNEKEEKVLEIKGDSPIYFE